MSPSNSLIKIKRTYVVNGLVKHLPASKSISNRALIIDALAGSSSELENLSLANDTRLMMDLIRSPEKVIDVEDAGTTMRFLTAYFAITGQSKLLTGTDRMQQRPIGLLVDALKKLGADIAYRNKDGYPPIEIMGFRSNGTKKISIRGDISSQFISSLMMVAPMLPEGLEIELTGKIGSRPYIELTADIMMHFGAAVDIRETSIQIAPGKYHPRSFRIESDWSAASYWYAFAALADRAKLVLPGLHLPSKQGDHVIEAIMTKLGVATHVMNDGLHLTKCSSEKHITFDFQHCPDLAQTICVVCAAKGISGVFTGMESLRIKETDRISALQTELSKIGARLWEDKDAQWRLTPAEALPAQADFSTYLDHRMAMSFAPLACMMDVSIDNPAVVKKSYPLFWDDVASAGFVWERVEK